ncbi:MAG TPA: SRPBCC family protein [Acidobacteriota bacterium]|jgi:ribosome-associated toxin RatA of RatAB toxin-antitoxin module|nr:SRPBCC family protein [Acidobacteriota bacterium]
MSFLRPSKSASAVLKCDAGLIYETLIDYDNYFEWLPFVSHSKLLAKEGDLAIAEFELLSQRHTKFAVECIHTKNKSVMIRKIAGDVPLHEVVWSLTPSGESTEVSLKMTRERTWKEFIPGFPRLATGDKYLAALKSRAAMFSSDFVLDGEVGEKIMEVFETDDGLDLWILGKKYALKAANGEKR